MDKQTFLEELNRSLLSKGISQSDAEGCVSRFENLIDSKPIDEQADFIASFGTPDEISRNFARMKSSEKAEGETADKNNNNAPAVIESRPIVKKRASRVPQSAKAKNAESEDTQKDEIPALSEDIIPTDDDEDVDVDEDEDADVQEYSRDNLQSEDLYAAEQYENEDAEEKEPFFASVIGKIKEVMSRLFPKKDERSKAKEDSVQDDRQQETDFNIPAYPAPKTEEKNKKEMKISNMSNRGKLVFILGLILTSPIWLAVTAFLAAFILALYLALAAISIVLIVAEILLIIGGGALALVGIVYGIIKLLPGSAVPFVGLYELGLGLIIGGVTLVVSVLIYTLIIIGFPFVVKYINKLASLLFKLVKKLFKYVKKECGKL